MATVQFTLNHGSQLTTALRPFYQQPFSSTLCFYCKCQPRLKAHTLQDQIIPQKHNVMRAVPWLCACCLQFDCMEPVCNHVQYHQWTVSVSRLNTAPTGISWRQWNTSQSNNQGFKLEVQRLFFGRFHRSGEGSSSGFHPSLISVFHLKGHSLSINHLRASASKSPANHRI